MERNILTRFGDELDDRLWHADGGELASWSLGFLDSCHREEVELADVLRLQPDETLALCVRKGVFVNEAYRELMWDRYWPLLSVWFQRIGRGYNNVPDYDEIEELSQELLFKLLANRFGSYQGDRVFGDYLYVVARNLFVDRTFRRRRATSLAPQYDEGGGAQADAEACYAEMIEAARSLPGDQGQVICLLLEGQSVKEIAEALGVPAQRVYKLRMQAWTQLAARFGLEKSPSAPTNRLEPCGNV